LLSGTRSEFEQHAIRGVVSKHGFSVMGESIDKMVADSRRTGCVSETQDTRDSRHLPQFLTVVIACATGPQIERNGFIEKTTGD
jgi:hypothetical protein